MGYVNLKFYKCADTNIEEREKTVYESETKKENEEAQMAKTLKIKN